MLDSIEQSMILVRDDEDAELPNVVCVAAQAVLLLINKYYSLMKGCELYVIAIGKCEIFDYFYFVNVFQSCAPIRSSNGSKIMATLLHRSEKSRRWSPPAGMKHTREKRQSYQLQHLIEAR